MYNNQEVFDIVAVHLLQQNEQSLVYSDYDTENCVYRNPHGLMCAIGCLIDNADYDTVMDIDNLSVDEILNRRIYEDNPSINRIRNLDIAFLVQLQCIHDSFRPKLWYEELVKFAENNQLNIDAIKKDKSND